ncbi:MAG: hypothetical protein OXE99_12690, partial [Cellvibrionales bacterium]|nr:hypothetical protein [Cellvibrionales bacterium]
MADSLDLYFVSQQPVRLRPTDGQFLQGEIFNINTPTACANQKPQLVDYALAVTSVIGGVGLVGTGLSAFMQPTGDKKKKHLILSALGFSVLGGTSLVTFMHLKRKPAHAQSPKIIPPEVPAKPLELLFQDQPTKQHPEAIIDKPLIKVAGDNGIKAYCSGRRSCVFECDKQWYRIKGCGNDKDGFVLTAVPKSASQQLRGSAFKQTALRECLMTESIDKILKGSGLYGCCNQPLGVYQYGQSTWPDPMLAKYEQAAPYAFVAKTQSEKRLGSHLLSGLDRLLPALIQPTLSLSDLIQLYPASRRDDSLNIVPIEHLIYQYASQNTPHVDPETLECILATSPIILQDDNYDSHLLKLTAKSAMPFAMLPDMDQINRLMRAGSKQEAFHQAFVNSVKNNDGCALRLSSEALVY